MQDLKNLNYLLPDTKSLLCEIIESAPFIRNYVLVGGSALALHLCHRQSEDLDFFTYEDSFNKFEIYEYIKRYPQKEILNQTDEQIDVLINGIKVTFFNAKWEFLRPEQIRTFNVASIEAIASMKVHTLFLRAKFRDYYDLYALSKSGMPLKQIYEQSKAFVEGLTFKLFAIAIIYIDDIEDDDIEHLNPEISISKQKIRAYFEEQLK